MREMTQYHDSQKKELKLNDTSYVKTYQEAYDFIKK